MKRGWMRYLLSLCCWFCTSFVWAQLPDSTQADIETIATDTLYQSDDADEDDYSTIDTALYAKVIFYPADSLQYWRNQAAFSYYLTLDSLLKARQQQEAVKPPPTVVRSSGAPILIRLLIWVVVLAGLIFLVYRLFLSEGRLFTSSVRKKFELQDADETVDPDELRIQLAAALQQKAYRQATRLQYLLLLQQLNTRRLIELAPDKTNYDYVKQVRHTTWGYLFARATLHYEYVWYGSFEPDAAQYKRIELDFHELQNQVR